MSLTGSLNLHSSPVTVTWQLPVLCDISLRYRVWSLSGHSGHRISRTNELRLSSSGQGRLPESLHFAESAVILGVVRARSVHKVGYGHNCDCCLLYTSPSPRDRTRSR